VKLEKIQNFPGKDLVQAYQAYAELDWDEYAAILKEVVTNGTFVA
jgi:hypothetical protein